MRFQTVGELKLNLKFTNGARLGFPKEMLEGSQLPLNTRRFYLVHDSAPLSAQAKILV